MVGADKGYAVGRRAYDSRLVAVEARIYELAQEVSAIRTSLDALERTLSGNGQPGLVQDFAAYKTRASERIGKLERVRWWLAGALFASWGAFGAYLKYFAGQ